jgi:superfamily II RNA helicase
MKNDSPEALLEEIFDWIAAKGIDLYPAQEEAILELIDSKNVILNTPTGSGKSLVAMAMHKLAMLQGRRSVYTCPIKALVNEKWLALCQEFGPENVGLATGDASVNRDAPILCCTAEILSNMALAEGATSPILDIVMDEFHYYTDKQRGVAWQIPLLTMPQSRFLLMSATLGETQFFEKALEDLTSQPAVTVQEQTRPVPLDFKYSTEVLPITVDNLVKKNQAPVYVVHFTQVEAAKNAQNFTSLDLCSKAEKQDIANALQKFKFSSPYGPDLKRWLRQGIGLHHAGLLPKYRILVESLAQKGLLKVICGTDTLGVGVNVPIRTVLFTQLCKYSGDKTAILTSRDFHQISGRAGRKGFDDVGYVVAQAPAHVIENLKLVAKKPGKKVVKKKAPERGYVPWDESTYEKLIQSSPEKLESRFQVSHGMLLNLLSRPDDGCQGLKDLIQDSHESSASKAKWRQHAFQLFKSLVNRDIISIIPPAQRDLNGAKVKVNVELQEDFSMNQALSLYLLDTLPLLEKEDDDYPLHVLTLVESILEDPNIILRKQLEKVKNEAMAEMKAEGKEYEERMKVLEELEYPKPMREFIYRSFNSFSDQHPWIDKENIKPKSIVREIVEEFSTFSGYIKKYGLQRSEGLLLRHVNSVYKVLAQTVPDSFKNEALNEMEVYLAEMLRRVDSSLLEEWEKMKNPNVVLEERGELEALGSENQILDVTRDRKTFVAAIRARIFSFLSSVARQDYTGALDILQEDLAENQSLTDSAGDTWTPAKLQERFMAFFKDHSAFLLNAEGRALRFTLVDSDRLEGKYLVWQQLQDVEDLNDWAVYFTVDLAQSKLAGVPVLTLEQIDELEFTP